MSDFNEKDLNAQFARGMKIEEIKKMIEELAKPKVTTSAKTRKQTKTHGTFKK
jgi:hypothetical protein